MGYETAFFQKTWFAETGFPGVRLRPEMFGSDTPTVTKRNARENTNYLE
ncbi:MAG: hypothetical protein HC849_05260 [Oscillatoriales cyanobacterium RU_3_3]|nr:hypothetical protein [Oscillatoriales cyanobacterium RU_3_3]